MKKILLIFIFLISACQTTTEVFEFRKLQKGMEKGEVVEIIGVPIRKERKDEKDWWYYLFYEDGLRFERMVVFESGKIIYAGRVTVKLGTDNSESVDRLNERTNELAPTEQIKSEN